MQHFLIRSLKARAEFLTLLDGSKHEDSINRIGYMIMRELAVYDSLLTQDLHSKKIYNSFQEYMSFLEGYIPKLYSALENHIRTNNCWPAINYLDFSEVVKIIDRALAGNKEALNELEVHFIYTTLLTNQIVVWLGYGTIGMNAQQAYEKAFGESCNLTNKFAIINKMIMDIYKVTSKHYLNPNYRELG